MPSFKKNALKFFKSVKERIVNTFRHKRRDPKEFSQSKEQHLAPAIEVETASPIEEQNDPIFTDNESKFQFLNLLPFSITFTIVEEIGSEFVLRAEKTNYLIAKENETLIAEFFYNGSIWTFQAKFGSLKDLQTAKFISEDNESIEIGWHSNQSTFTFFQRIRLINNTNDKLEYVQVVKFCGERRFKQINESSNGCHPVYLKYEPDYLFVAHADPQFERREVWTRVLLSRNADVECKTIDGCIRPITVTNNRNGLEREVVFSPIHIQTLNTAMC